MMNNILLLLASMSSITGVQCGISYELSNDDINLIAQSIHSTISYDEYNHLRIDNVTHSCDVFELDGSNRYIEFDFNDNGYLLFDKKIKQVVECDYSGGSPYSSLNFLEPNSIKIYSNSEHLYFDGSNIFSLDSIINNDITDYHNYLPSCDYFAGNYYDIDSVTISNDAVFIDNSFYFEKLNDCHGFNDGDICGIISTQILLGYYDTFFNDDLVSDEFDIVSTTDSSVTGISDFTQSPGTGWCPPDLVSEGDQRFRDALLDIAIDQQVYSGNGMYISGQITLIQTYLNSIGFSNEYFFYTANNAPLTPLVIKNAIDHNRPVIANGSGHSIVAYGYDEQFVYVHTGWGYVAATPWETFSMTGYEKGAIDIYLACPHIHSDNYYSNADDIYFCVDGHTFSKVEISPDDYGFAQRYYFYEKTTTHYFCDDPITIKRLRTGFIENEYINLSPRREGAGFARLEYHLPFVVDRIKIDISLWSEYEFVDDPTCYAYIQYKDIYGEWNYMFDLFNDIDLSTDRYNQNHLSLTFSEDDAIGFRIITNNLATGDRNKGRISIGDLEIIYEND